MRSILFDLRDWVDARFPLTKLWNEHLAEYYAPKNFNFWYFFGSLALLVLVMQLITGIWLAMYYQPSAAEAFSSIEFIMRDVEWGWLIRYMHSTGASFFFVVVYLHMFRGVMYGSFKKPRELVWVLGMMIYGVLMAEAFMGYLLPWGLMSYWGAQVIISLFGALPGIGEPLALWIRGDYSVSDATLTRFYAMHVVLVPLVLLGLIGAHIMALHEVGSNNPDGVEIKANKDDNGIPKDGIPFHPYYTVKDLMGAGVFLFIFFFVVFYFPEMGGWFLEKDNFDPANPVVTPDTIVPLWYFTPYYAILRAIPDKLTGVLAMGLSIFFLFLLPWIDTHPIKSIRYRSALYKLLIMVFALTFVVLGYLGTQKPTPEASEMGLRLGEIYFGFFVILWIYSKDRSAKFYIGAFGVILALLLLVDGIRLIPDKLWLMAGYGLIPLMFFAIFLLVPIVTNLNESRPVPERVTW